jgi:DNA-directed RNA polymerase specialized sigma24 family protein
LDTPVSLLDRLCDKPDASSRRRWFDLYTPLIRQWLARYALQPHDADDVVQEVLVVVFLIDNPHPSAIAFKPSFSEILGRGCHERRKKELSVIA